MRRVAMALCGFVAALVLVGVGCARRPAGGGATAASPPAAASGASSASSDSPTFVAGDVEKMYARELPPLPITKFTAGDLTGEIESAGPPVTEQREDSARFTFPLGTQSPILCFVYPEPIPVGAQLLKVIKAIEGVDVRLVRPTDVTVIGDHVAVYLEAQYLAKTGKGAALGQVKVMAYGHARTPLLCMHDELGYNDTFKRITTRFASSLKLAGGELRIPAFVEISITTLNAHPTGFTRSIVLPGDKGGSVEISATTTLNPRSERDLIAEDTTRMTTVDAHGQVVEIDYSSQEGEDLTEDITLKLVGRREYAYDGTHLGKKIAGKLQTKSAHGFPSDADDAREVLKLLGDKAASPELRTEEYHPDLDPTAPIETVTRVASKKDRTVTVTFGQMQVTAAIDDHGLMAKGEMSLGPATMAVSRALIRGSL